MRWLMPLCLVDNSFFGCGSDLEANAIGCYITYIIIQLTPHWDFSVTDYIKYFAHVTYLA